MEDKLSYYMNLPYKVEITPIPDCEGGGYAANLPEIGRSAIVGDGDTPEEALQNLKAIQEDIFTEYIQKGIKIPEPAPSEEKYSGKFIVRVPSILHKELATRAEEENVSLNSYVNYLLSCSHERTQVIDTVSEQLTNHTSIIKKEIQRLSYQISDPSFSLERDSSTDIYLDYESYGFAKAA